MTTTIADAALPSLTSGLGTLLSLLAKAEAHAQEADIEPSELLEARLIPDMFSFAEQIQTAADTARRGVQRLSGEEPSSVADPEPTFASLRACIQSTMQIVADADRQRIDESADKSMTVGFGPDINLEFTGRSYLLSFLLPNSMFHVSTAYGILRSKGVALGKIDLLAPFVKEFEVKFV